MVRGGFLCGGQRRAAGAVLTRGGILDGGIAAVALRGHRGISRLFGEASYGPQKRGDLDEDAPFLWGEAGSECLIGCHLFGVLLLEGEIDIRRENQMRRQFFGAQYSYQLL